MEILLYRENFYCQGLLFFTLLHVSAFFLIYIIYGFQRSLLNFNENCNVLRYIYFNFYCFLGVTVLIINLFVIFSITLSILVQFHVFEIVGLTLCHLLL
jgi:hypothetical protein